jgi:bacterioferritin
VASKKLLELLNKGIARELRVSIQYMWQHVLAKGIEGAIFLSQKLFINTEQYILAWC